MANKEKDINTNIKQAKKKGKIFLIIIILFIIAIGGFIVTTIIKKQNPSNLEQNHSNKGNLSNNGSEITNMNSTTPSEDFELTIVDNSEKIYLKDIPKQTYMLKDGVLLFEGTIIFKNKLCANLYTGITDIKSMKKTEPKLEEDVIGDKLVKDSLTRYIKETPKTELMSIETLSTGLTKAINKQFKNTFGYEVVKNILVTNYIIQ